MRRASATATVLLAAATASLLSTTDSFALAKLTVSPLTADLEADAGETVTQPVQVTASGDEPIVVQFSHVDFGFDTSSYDVSLVRDDAKETTAFSTRDWFRTPKRTYAIPAGQTVTVPVRITVPSNTPGGTYTGGALARIVPPASSGATQVQAVAETGPLLFIRVAGGTPPKPKVDRFEVPGHVSHGPVVPKLRVRNDGDDFFTYEGTVRLTGPGRDDTVDVARQYVLPGQPRDVTPKPGTHGASSRLQLGRHDLKFGHYTVTSRLRIEPTGTTLVSTRQFWVVPTWVRVAGALLLAVLVALAVLLVRWVRMRGRTEPYVAPVTEETDTDTDDDSFGYEDEVEVEDDDPASDDAV
ncbi:MAG: hypothetical protein JWM98_7 [Thermoleophilia bacterium]|nr:hypothetical protein [Thermoleophilia bacterium]